MADYHDFFGREILPLALVVLAAIMIVAYALLRVERQRERVRRRVAWQAKRAEEDRIWNERSGGK